MTTETLRIAVAALALAALAILWATTLIRWTSLPRETRNRGIAIFPTYLAIVYGVLEALRRDLPLNHGLYLTAGALLIFNAVWGYYLVKEARHP